jgi:hypothetical protein
MPDDQILIGRPSTVETLKEAVPPVLMALGALSLMRRSRILTLLALGALLYDAAANSDTDRKVRGRDLRSKRRASALLDAEIEDSFPASDPPSFSGNTVGAP